MHWLTGALYRALAPLLDGRRTADEIAAALEGQHGAAEVHYALERLAQKGYLAEPEPGHPPARTAFWHSLGSAPGEAEARMAGCKVEVRALGEVPAAPVVEALREEGFGLAERDGALAVVVVDDYLRAELAPVNREALRSGRSWVLLRPVGRTVWLGPRFVPGQSACWECLAHRLRNNTPFQALAASRPARAALEGSVRAAAHLLAVSLARGAVTGEGELAGALVALDTVRLRAEHHPVVRRPQCPACGEPGLVAARQRRPVSLESRPVAFGADGGHRTVSPEETARQLERQVSPLTGIVQGLQPVPSGGELAPLFDAGHNLARRAEGPRFLREALRGHSIGKGKTSAQARASGLGEAIERYCGVLQGDEARRRERMAALGADAVHPHRLLLFSERQYRERQAWNDAHPAKAHRVPHPFQEELQIDWTPAWSLTHRATRYVPTALCFYDYPPEEAPFGSADSNGCAAGNCAEEAILQGFLELAERDAVALWWYNRTRRPRVALEHFDEPYLLSLAGHYRRLGRECWVLDLTTDLGVPTFAAVSRQVDGAPERLTFGFGAHLEARLGVLRAVTEMNQFLPFLQEALDGSASPEPSGAGRWLKEATTAEHPYLLPAEAPPVVAGQYPRLWSGDLRDDVERCVSLAGRLGLETLVLDQTRPDAGLSVVRVMVPGLRHMWPRLGPGRLYDAPVRLGWLPRPTPEERLNPTPMFI